MTAPLQYQVRFDLADTGRAEALRQGRAAEPALAPLAAVLARHRAVAKCQYDAFADYVAAAEQRGVDQFPLFAWTKATIENPVHRAPGNATHVQAARRLLPGQHSRAGQVWLGD